MIPTTKTGDILSGGWRVGYARVSTEDQNLALQLDALGRCGCSQIWEEKTGSTKERPELQACLKSLRAGDTLVVWRFDRLSRSLAELVATVNDLAKRGIALESLTEKIDTSSATGTMIFHVFATLAEFERNLTRERTKAGLEAARARGRLGGRREKLTSEQKIMVATLMADRTTVPADVCAQFKIGRSTLYKVLREVTPPAKASEAQI